MSLTIIRNKVCEIKGIDIEKQVYENSLKLFNI